MAEQIINIERMEQVVGLFGNLDENVRMIESELPLGRNKDIGRSGERHESRKNGKRSFVAA